MIQRIQSVFLAICAFIFITFIFAPIKFIKIENDLVGLTALSGFITKFSFSFTFSLVSGFIFIGMAASIVSIFCYRQRYLQIRFCYIIAFVAALCLCLINFTGSVEGYGRFESVSLASNIMWVTCIIFAILASVFIKKDINLLKKADRLR